MTTELIGLTQLSIPVLGTGWIRLDRFMGSDATIINAARLSRRSKGNPDADYRLMRRLMRKKEGVPFEHPAFGLRARMPGGVLWHMIRYRISSFSVESRRVTAIDGGSFILPSGLLDDPIVAAHFESSIKCFNHLMDKGERQDIARWALPMFAVGFELDWTLNARSLINVLQQRLHPSAQPETREYARALFVIFQHCLPMAARALMELKPKLFEGWVR